MKIQQQNLEKDSNMKNNAKFLKEYFEKFAGDELKRILTNENSLKINNHREVEELKKCLLKENCERGESEIKKLVDHLLKFKFFQ